MKWPKMISTKDLAYIEDMFNWNDTLRLKLNYFIEECFDDDLCPYLNEALKVTNNNVKNLKKLLESGDKNDVLQTVKGMVTNYAYALNEASSEFIYQEFFNEFETLSKLAKELYNFAYNLGWVSLTEASNKDIKTELTREKNILTNI